jgi:hypothetical protein
MIEIAARMWTIIRYEVAWSIKPMKQLSSVVTNQQYIAAQRTARSANNLNPFAR